MEALSSTRVLIVAHKTAATPTLIERVRQRAIAGPCTFTLLVPRTDRVGDPESEDADHVLELAIPLLEEAAGSEVEGIVGESDPYVAVRDLLRRRDFDEIIVSTLPERVSRWLRRDLPRRLQELGKPVSVITAPQARRPVSGPPNGFGA